MKKIRVNIGYYDFKFDNVNEAVKFAEMAFDHKAEPISIDIDIDFEDESEDE